MDQNKDRVQNKPKRSVLSLLNRRSTKVEPQVVVEEEEEEQNIPIQPSNSAHSTPIKRISECSLRRHNSSQDINLDSASSRCGMLKPKIFTASNRLSHQFGLCCSIDERAVTPIPVTVRYKSMPDIETKKISSQQPRHHHQNGFSNATVLEAHEVIVHRPPKTPPSSEPASPQRPSSTTVQNSSHNSPATEPNHKIQFTEIHNSIAMSACRSRLREKILGNAVHQQESQHSSSPNVSTVNSISLEPPPDPNRSLSYDGLVPASTNSLAKQSLIAAQLLNLIPTEKARER